MELNFEWIIREPDFLSQKNGEHFYSPVFSSQANKKIRWRLKIYPKGLVTNKDYVGLYVKRVVEEDDLPIIVKSKFVSLSRNTKKIAIPQLEVVKEIGNAPLPKNWGWPKLVALDAIQRDSLHTGPDELIINIQIVYTI